LLPITLQASEAVILPPHAEQTVKTIYEKYKSLNTGKNADYIPELAKTNPNYFAIAIVTVDGKLIQI
jgi:glutaminase